MIRPTVLALLCIVCLPWSAQGQGTAPADIPRRNATEQQAFDEGCGDNQFNLNVCASYDFRVLDVRLNALYRKQMARLKDAADDRKRLQEAQRAWLKYVEADCLYQNGTAAESGSIWPLLDLTCRSAHWKERVRILESFVNCTQDGCKGN